MTNFQIPAISKGTTAAAQLAATAAVLAEQIKHLQTLQAQMVKDAAAGVKNWGVTGDAMHIVHSINEALGQES